MFQVFLIKKTGTSEIISNYFKNGKIGTVEILSNSFRNKEPGVPELFSKLFQKQKTKGPHKSLNKTLEDSEILSNFF